MATPNLRIAGDDPKALPARMAFTEARVKAATCPPGDRRRMIYDDTRGVKGLALQITANGSKSFYWYGRVRGLKAPIRFHMGEWDALKVVDAQKWAAEIYGDAMRGIDPRNVKRQNRAEEVRKAAEAETVADAWQQYLDGHLKITARPHTIRTDESRYKLHLSAWADKPILSITPTSVAEFHQQMTADRTKGPNVADKTVKLLRRILKFKRIRPNPAAGGKDGDVRFHGDRKVTTFISPEQMPAVLAAIDACENQVIADVIRFMLMTGARRGNACSARWQDVSLSAGRWIVPEDQSKNRKPMTIPLAPDAIDLLKRRRAEVDAWLKKRQRRYKLAKPETCAYVFPGRTPDVPLTEVKTTWDKIRKAAGIPHVRIHDLRHTLASWMADQGASLLQIQRQLGHADIQSTMRYTHADAEIARPATTTAVAAMLAKTATKRSCS